MDDRCRAGGSVDISPETSCYFENRRITAHSYPSQAEFRSACGKAIGVSSYIECLVGGAVYPDARNSSDGECSHQLYTPLLQPRPVGNWTGMRRCGACDNGKIRTEWNTISRYNWIMRQFGRVRHVILLFSKCCIAEGVSRRKKMPLNDGARGV